MKHEKPSSLGTRTWTESVTLTERAIARAPWVRRIPLMFVLIVVIPVLVTSIYYLFIAAPMYVSEAQFIVREKSETSLQPGGSGGMLQKIGLGDSDDVLYAHEVEQYMVSRNAVFDLERNIHLRTLFARPEADFMSRFPRPFEGDSFENLFFGFQRFVTVGMNQQTNISTVEARAYRPEDARAIADALLAGGEALVNKLNARSLADTVGQAERQLADAEAAAADAQTALTLFRNKEGIVNANLTSEASTDLTAGLESQVATLRAQRAGLAASAPTSPQLPVLDRNIAAFEAQIASEGARTAGQANSLAPKVSRFERLTLDQDIAGKALADAESSLESARLDAMRDQLYLERVVTPNLPDKAEQPKRFNAILTVLVASLVAYAVISLLVAGLREHRQR
jgi:capsular polysaccharide transport system permease protein